MDRRSRRTDKNTKRTRRTGTLKHTNTRRGTSVNLLSKYRVILVYKTVVYIQQEQETRSAVCRVHGLWRPRDDNKCKLYYQFDDVRRQTRFVHNKRYYEVRVSVCHVCACVRERAYVYVERF